MSARREMEADAFAQVVAGMRAEVDRQAETLRRGGSTLMAERVLEYRYALISTLEAAVSGGLDPTPALIATRDSGLLAWATKHMVQHGGRTCPKCVDGEIEAIATGYLRILGVPASVTSEWDGEAPQPTALH